MIQSTCEPFFVVLDITFRIIFAHKLEEKTEIFMYS